VTSNDANGQARRPVLDQIIDRAGLPHAPMAMPKQTLEMQQRWLFAIYARLLRRT